MLIKQARFFVFVFGMMIYVCACNKAISTEFVAYDNNPLNDTTWSTTNLPITYYNAFLAPVQTLTIVDSFSASIGAVKKYGDSLQVIFPANNYTTQNGNTITGNVKCEFTVLYKKSDFIKYLKPTTSGNLIFNVGNLMNVRLTQYGQDLICKPNNPVKIKIKAAPFDNALVLYNLSTTVNNNDTSLVWNKDNTGNNLTAWKDTLANNSIQTNGYAFNSTKLQWFSSAVAIDSLLPKTRINVTLPLNFTNKNTIVFAVLNEKKSVIRLNAESSKKMFTVSNIPTNTPLTLVTLSVINNMYFLGTKAVTNNSADAITILPQKKLLNDIIATINNL